jgi:hypothetical protein
MDRLTPKELERIKRFRKDCYIESVQDALDPLIAEIEMLWEAKRAKRRGRPPNRERRCPEPTMDF